MTDKDLWQRRKNALSPSYKHFYEEPIHLVRGDDVWVWDEKGNKYLDCYNNVVSVGHANERVVQALYNQAKTLNTHTRYLTEGAIILAERLKALLPAELDTCFFVCTGTEANDLAIQLARTYTGREGIIVSDAAYHGNSTTVGALSLERKSTIPPKWIATVEPPNTYRGRHPSNDREAGEAYAGDYDKAIKRLNDDGIGAAAALIDMSFDSNGILMPPFGYFDAVQARLKADGCLMISDEVQAGYCRLGKTFWGFERYGQIPDIVTMGKPMGDGHPLAAVVTKRHIADKFAAESHYFNTFGGNPVSSAVGVAVLDEIEGRGLLASITELGSQFKRGLESIQDNSHRVGNIQGDGLFWGMDLVEDRESKAPLSSEALRGITTALKNEGILVGSTGRFGNILKIRPPLTFSQIHMQQCLDALYKVLRT